jgi:hypothetical protein
VGGEITALWKVLAQQAVGRSYVCQAATPRARPPCSRCFVANASAMGPADQELGGHDRSDTGFGQQRGPGRVLRDEDQQLDIQLSGLVDQEPDTSGDRAR